MQTRAHRRLDDGVVSVRLLQRIPLRIHRSNSKQAAAAAEAAAFSLNAALRACPYFSTPSLDDVGPVSGTLGFGAVSKGTTTRFSSE
jgi:hypothetical protein